MNVTIDSPLNPECITSRKSVRIGFNQHSIRQRAVEKTNENYSTGQNGTRCELWSLKKQKPASATRLYGDKERTGTSIRHEVRFSVPSAERVVRCYLCGRERRSSRKKGNRKWGSGFATATTCITICNYIVVAIGGLCRGTSPHELTIKFDTKSIDQMCDKVSFF